MLLHINVDLKSLIDGKPIYNVEFSFAYMSTITQALIPSAWIWKPHLVHIVKMRLVKCIEQYSSLRGVKNLFSVEKPYSRVHFVQD